MEHDAQKFRQRSGYRVMGAKVTELSLNGPTSQWLGLIVYLADIRQQNLLLRSHLYPSFVDLCQRGKVGSWTFLRYDARGPHFLFIIQCVAPREEVSASLRRIVGRSLDIVQPYEFAAESCWARHNGCRGRIMCPIDAATGIGVQGEYHLFNYSKSYYPFVLFKHRSIPPQFAESLHSIASWCATVSASAVESSMIWLSLVRASLDKTGRDARAFFDYYFDKLRAPGSPPVSLGKLNPSKHLNENAMLRLQEIWRRPPELGLDSTTIDKLIASCYAARPEDPFSVIREMVHLVIGQIGLMCAREIVLVIFIITELRG